MTKPNLQLTIGGSSYTQNLSPNSVNLYDNLDARTTFSFTLNQPATAARPIVGQPVYLDKNISWNTPRWCHAADVFGGNIVTGWGYGSTGEELSDSWGYNAGNQWTKNNLFGVALILPTLTNFNNNLWLVGGTRYSTAKNEVWFLQNNQWNLQASSNVSWTPRYGHAACSLGSNLWITGGFTGAAPLNETWYSNGGVWIRGSTITWPARWQHGLAVWLNNMFIMGGKSTADTALNDVYFGDGITSWVQVSTVATWPARYGHNVLTFNNKLWVFGGCGTLATKYNDVWNWDGISAAWNLVTPSAQWEARQNAVAGVLDNKLWIIGGYGSTVLGDIWYSYNGADWYQPTSSSCIFGGTLDNYTETCYPQANELNLQCNCVDFTQMVGKRLVYKSYTSSGYDADIIKDINTNFFNGEGIDCTTYVSTGITIPELNFNYVPGNEALNTICKLTGRSWYIDADKKLHYFAANANSAPISLNSTSNNWRNLSVKRSRDRYRNKEYLYGVKNITSTFTEYFPGDGNTRTWGVSYPIYSTPSIFVDGFTASVGILGVSASTFGFYWNKESQTISQNSSNTALASTDVLRVDYIGLYPIVAVSANDDEIAARAAIEGNSGIYESADKTSKIYTANQAFESGDAMIQRYGEIAGTVRFETDIDGLKAGQLIYINIPNNETNNYFLITDVSGTDVNLATMRYKVTATSGQDRGGWASYFRSLLRNDADPLGTPFDNTYQFTLRKSYGTIRFIDSGATYTTYVIIAALVDSAIVDSSMVWI